METRARSADFILSVWEVIREFKAGGMVSFELKKKKKSLCSRHDDKMQCGFLDWILDQKRSLVGKVVNSKWSLQFSVLVKSCITHVDFLDLTHGPGLQVDFRGAG